MIEYPQTAPFHLEEYIEAWVEGMTSGTLTGRIFSSSTISIYHRYAVDFFASYSVLTTKTAKKAFAAIPAVQFAKREKLHRTLISFAKFLVEESFMEESELLRLQKLQPKRHLPPKKITVNAKQLEALVAVCQAPLDKLIVILLSSTGLRASEACGLKMADIDLENRELHVRIAKWGKSRKVGLSAMAIQAIQEYLKVSPRQKTDAPLFLNRKQLPMDRHGLNERLQRIGKLAGIPVSPHALRRAFVTINANNGKPLQMLQMACGHSDIQTTRNYCMTTEEEVINAMKSW